MNLMEYFLLHPVEQILLHGLTLNVILFNLFLWSSSSISLYAVFWPLTNLSKKNSDDYVDGSNAGVEIM